MLLDPSRRTKALAVGCSAHVVQDGLTAATYVLLPILSQVFGLGYAEVGLFKGLKSLAQAGLEMCSGVLSERIGAGRVLVLGLVLAGAGYAGLADANGPGIVLLCLLIVGVGSAFQHAPASAIVSESSDERGRRGALGVYNSSGDVGKLLFASGFSGAIALGFGWQGIALFYGLLALVAAMAIAIATDALRGLRWRSGPSAGRAAEAAIGWGILDWRSFCTLLVVVFLDNMVQAGVLVFIAFLMIAKGLPLALATMAAVMVLAGGVFGKAGCGFLAQRIGVRRAFSLVQILTAVGLLGVVAAPTWLAFALLLPLGVVAQGSTSITYGLVPDLVDPRRVARGYALMYSSTSFASAAGPFGFGLIADAFGISTAVLVMSATTMLSIPPLAFLMLEGRGGRSSD